MELPVEREATHEEIAKQVNQILDQFIEAPKAAPKWSFTAGVEYLRVVRDVFMINMTSKAILQQIRDSGALRIMPRTFKQRVFYVRQATDAERAEIDDHMEALLNLHDDFRATFSKIHAIACKAYPAASPLPADPGVVEEKAKNFQWDFGLAFRGAFHKKLEEMKQRQCFAELFCWLQSVKELHESLDQLDQKIPSIIRLTEKQK
ncbi:hypothetical protein PCANC_07679 [Puccinia coronata f. sp. avenae]|uniref:Uncharacterized protein n=1 Tax=Puccinia coronata f. sp. avenae TaxID=200324 RepID=A0A2N5T2N6_9BASI|nr:hypothetical protein PCANC_07679 [Puccinia coronata f. sp. avenae]